MSQRLQVLLSDSEMDEIRNIAQRHGMTVGQWVRNALKAARKQEPSIDASARLKAIRAAAEYSFPTADIDQMLSEIERGYEA